MTSKNNKAPWTAIPNMNLHPKNSDIFHGDGRDPKVGWLGLDSKKLALPSSHSLREPASVTIQHKGTDPKLGWLGFDRKEIALPPAHALPTRNSTRFICQNCHWRYDIDENKEVCTQCGSLEPLNHPSHPRGGAGKDGKPFQNPWGPGKPIIPGGRWELRDRVKGSEK